MSQDNGVYPNCFNISFKDYSMFAEFAAVVASDKNVDAPLKRMAEEVNNALFDCVRRADEAQQSAFYQPLPPGFIVWQWEREKQQSSTGA